MFISRQQKLLHILIQDSDWYTLSDLAYQLGCANKTIRRDVAYLKTYLPPNWKIESVKGRGIRLRKPVEDGIKELNLIFEQYDMTFQILNQLFYESATTMKQLASNLYIQTASLYKYLKRVQIYLSHFSLKIIKQPLRIQGDESHIVFLFSELYIKVYNGDTWPFSHFPQEEILNYIAQIENVLQIKLSPVDKQKVSYSLAILLHRKQRGYELLISSEHESFIVNTMFYQKISTLSDTICHMKLQTYDKIFITIVINCSNYMYNDVENHKQFILHDFKTNDHVVYKYVKELIISLENTCDISLIQNEQFIFHMIQHLKQTIYKYRLVPNIEPPPENTIHVIKHTYTQTFQQVKRVYLTWIQKYNIASFVWEEDVIVVTLFIESIKLLSQSPVKRALLYTEDHFTWSPYICGILYHTFGSSLQVESLPSQQIETLDMGKLHADLIITTVPFPKIDVPTIRISKIPTKRELKDIEVLLCRLKNTDL